MGFLVADSAARMSFLHDAISRSSVAVFLAVSIHADASHTMVMCLHELGRLVAWFEIAVAKCRAPRASACPLASLPEASTLQRRTSFCDHALEKYSTVHELGLV